MMRMIARSALLSVALAASAPGQAAEPPAVGDAVFATYFCWRITVPQQLAAYGAAGDEAAGTKRLTEAFENGECVFVQRPVPATIVEIAFPVVRHDGALVYVLAVRPAASAVIVFGTRVEKPEGS